MASATACGDGAAGQRTIGRSRARSCTLRNRCLTPSTAAASLRQPSAVRFFSLRGAAATPRGVRRAGTVLADVGAATQDVVPYTRDPRVKKVTAPADARPLVVLPGFGNNTKDYTAPFGDTSLALTTHLEARHRTSSGSASSLPREGCICTRPREGDVIAGVIQQRHTRSQRSSG